MRFINESASDRVIRILTAIALAYVAWITWPAAIAVVSLVFAAVAFATGIIGWCPGYAAFGISSRKHVGP